MFLSEMLDVYSLTSAGGLGRCTSRGESSDVQPIKQYVKQPWGVRIENIFKPPL